MHRRDVQDTMCTTAMTDETDAKLAELSARLPDEPWPFIKNALQEAFGDVEQAYRAIRIRRNATLDHWAITANASKPKRTARKRERSASVEIISAPGKPSVNDMLKPKRQAEVRSNGRELPLLLGTPKLVATHTPCTRALCFFVGHRVRCLMAVSVFQSDGMYSPPN